MDLNFLWNGQTFKARHGDSIAAALTEAGIQTFGEARSGRKRGLFCGMGVCQECLVIVNGARSHRACMTQVRNGMVVEAQADTQPLAMPECASAPEGQDSSVDLAIIGAGPAGLNAALVASGAGISVLVIDERTETGGQFFKPRSEGYRRQIRTDVQHQKGDALRARVQDSGTEILKGETVWFARKNEGASSFELRTLGPSGQTRVTARTVILATGAMERPAMIPGWTRPGVMTIGAAQTLVRRYGVAPGRRVLVAGHGPLGLQLAAEMTRIGVNVVAVAERGIPKIGAAFARAAWNAPGLMWDGIGYRADLLRNRVPVLSGWEATQILGADPVTGARLERIADGTRRDVEADTICLGEGFDPQVELARLMGVPVEIDPASRAPVPTRDHTCQTPVDGLWIAGDAGGLGGAQMAEAQGQIAAAGAVAFLRRDVPDVQNAFQHASQAQKFQSALWQMYDTAKRGSPADATTICQCEEITAGQIRGAISDGAKDPGSIKRTTRLGMGRCQGRYCLPAALRILAEDGQTPDPKSIFAPQVPARPVSIAALALEKPEWGGHTESSPGARPGRLSVQPLEKQARSCDLVIIGGGVTGVSAALYAARAGADVICLDRGAVNGEASGGNAGSLHLQLLSWDFGTKAVSGGSPQLLTLPLQQESIALWKTLETELGADFEMKKTGGLMVAEDHAQIAFLDSKVAAEAKVGIASELIDAKAVQELIPAISNRVVAGAWCAGEGKINPLTATNALARAARHAGARIEEFTPVDGIQRDGTGYELTTPRGTISAQRVLIAAGGWSTQIAEMLGAKLPIRGAPLQMVVSEPAPPLLPCLLAHADRHLTMKQTDAGTILIGGAWTAATARSGQPQVLPKSLEGNLWVASHTIPALGNLVMVRSWAAMNIDIDGAPVIGPLPDHPNVVVAATANGYTLGPLMGREASHMALTGKPRPDLAPFSLNRFNQQTEGSRT